MTYKRLIHAVSGSNAVELDSVFSLESASVGTRWYSIRVHFLQQISSVCRQCRGRQSLHAACSVLLSVLNSWGLLVCRGHRS